MLRRLHVKLTHSVLLGAVCAVTFVMNVSAGGLSARPGAGMRQGLTASTGQRSRHTHRIFRRNRFVRRHFFGPAVNGLANGSSGYPAPAPVDSEGSFGYGPQIITLPDQPPTREEFSRSQANSRVEPAPLPRAFGKPSSVKGRPRDFAYHHYRRPWFDSRPAYAGQLSAIAFTPCNDAPFGPIYNTPCGVRPFDPPPFAEIPACWFGLYE
jgi:hypothetical protein